MKKLFFMLCGMALLTACSSSARTYPDFSKSSGFSLEHADSKTLENLDVLGRVWGYVKYHHPVFATNAVDVDYELFGLLPRIAPAEKEARNDLLCKWIKGLGEYESDSTYYDRFLSGNNHDWLTRSEWITPDHLGTPLCEALRKMKYTPRKHNRYLRTGMQNPELRNEHTNGKIEDCGYRLLLLYRYWNVIEYYGPNRKITDKDWNVILTEFLPRFIAIKNDAEFWPVYLQLNASLCDGHAAGPEFILTGTRLLPIRARYFGDRMIVTDAELLAPGDQILSVDTVRCDSFIAKMRTYVAASNPAAAARHTTRLALSSNKDSVDVTYLHTGQNRTKRLATLSPADYSAFFSSRDSVRHGSFRLLDKSVGYLYAGAYREKDAEAIMDRFKETKALIVDLRCYPGEFMILNFIGRYFISEPIHSVTWGTPVSTMPGLMLYQDFQLPCSNTGKPYDGKVIVLVDETTLSQAEYTAMTFQATPHCTVIGSQTAGADGDVSYIPLPCDMRRLFSGLGVYYPDGTNTQRAGVRIDIEVEPTIEGLRNGRDEILEKALEIATRP